MEPPVVVKACDWFVYLKVHFRSFHFGPSSWMWRCLVNGEVVIQNLKLYVYTSAPCRWGGPPSHVYIPYKIGWAEFSQLNWIVNDYCSTCISCPPSVAVMRSCGQRTFIRRSSDKLSSRRSRLFCRNIKILVMEVKLSGGIAQGFR